MIDLDELERKARSATPGPWVTHTPGCNQCDHICGWSQHHEAEGPFGGISATGPDVWTKEQALLDAAHIAANSPTVTLELVARIRDLESGLSKAIAGWTHDPDLSDLCELLDRGAFTPASRPTR